MAVQWEIAWKGAFLAGALAALLTAVPYVSVGCCLWLLGAGALAVALYLRRLPGTFVTPGMGMRIGALAGVIGFVFNSLWSVVRFGARSQEFRTALQEQLQRSAASNPDPRTQEMTQQFINNLNTPAGLATFFVLMLVILGIVFVVFAAAGGALGASLSAGRREFR